MDSRYHSLMKKLSGILLSSKIWRVIRLIAKLLSKSISSKWKSKKKIINNLHLKVKNHKKLKKRGLFLQFWRRLKIEVRIKMERRAKKKSRVKLQHAFLSQKTQRTKYFKISVSNPRKRSSQSLHSQKWVTTWWSSLIRT